MIEGVTLAFACGLFALVCPCAIPFAAALVGLPMCGAGAERPSAAAQGAIKAAVAIGVGFALVFVLAALGVSAGLGRLLAAVPWIAVAIGIALAAIGAEAMVAGRVGARLLLARVAAAPDRGVPLWAGAYGAVYALVAVPCLLNVFRAFVDQGTEANGAGAAVAVTLAFGAGCASAAAVLTLLAALGLGVEARAGDATRRVIGRAAGALVAVAGISLVLYWLPALLGGRIERGGATAGATEDLSSAVTEALARYELVFALVLVMISGLALAVALRPRAR